MAVYDIIADESAPLDSQNQYTITIPVGGLTADREYTIRLYSDAHCRYGDSDERAIASLVTAGNVTLSIGAQYLNEDEKLNQAVPAIADGSDIGRQMPMQCDISKNAWILGFRAAGLVGLSLPSAR